MASKPDPLDPALPKMQTEPARNVAEFFASKLMIRTLVAAIAGVIAGVLKVTVDNDVIDNVTTIILFGWPLVMAFLAKMEQRRMAKQQGELTRDRVFAPASVEVERRKAYEAALPPIEPMPPAPDPAEEVEDPEAHFKREWDEAQKRLHSDLESLRHE